MESRMAAAREGTGADSCAKTVEQRKARTVVKIRKKELERDCIRIFMAEGVYPSGIADRIFELETS